MWLIDYVTKNSIPNPQSEKGDIKSYADGKVQVNASSDFKQLPIVTPYGVAYCFACLWRRNVSWYS